MGYLSGEKVVTECLSDVKCLLIIVVRQLERFIANGKIGLVVAF